MKMTAPHCVLVDVSEERSYNEMTCYIHHRKMAAPCCIFVGVCSVKTKGEKIL
jgi:hypothetical protein